MLAGLHLTWRKKGYSDHAAVPAPSLGLRLDMSDVPKLQDLQQLWADTLKPAAEDTLQQTGAAPSTAVAPPTQEVADPQQIAPDQQPQQEDEFELSQDPGQEAEQQLPATADMISGVQLVLQVRS